MKNTTYKFQENAIGYSILNDFVIVNFILFNDSINLFHTIKHFFDYFIDNFPQCNFLISYPGSPNPLVAKAGLDVFKFYNFNYRIYYDGDEILDKENFEQNILTKHIELLSDIHSAEPQCACKGNIASCSRAVGFKQFGVCSPLKSGINSTQSLLRYYKMDEDGYLISEHEEKPTDTDKLWRSIKLQENFQNHRIRIENNTVRYYPLD